MAAAMALAFAVPLIPRLCIHCRRISKIDSFHTFPLAHSFAPSSLPPSIRLSHCESPHFCFSSRPTITPSKSALQNIPVVSEGKEEEETSLICPGCGVFLQNSNPTLPGFYQEPSGSSKQSSVVSDDLSFDSDGFLEELDEEIGQSSDGPSDEKGTEIDEDFDSGVDEDEEREWMMIVDALSPAGSGYGDTIPEKLMKRKRISKSEKKKKIREAKRDESECSARVCARCHSLRNYGQVKDQKVENLIPDFDFDRLISTKLVKSLTSAPVVIIVVDCVDFEGSFPQRAAKSLFQALEKASMDRSKKTKVPKLVLVANKVDLLPPQTSPARLEKWVRRCAKAAGAPKLNGVYLVSALKNLGVRNLISFIKELAGPRGNVWVIGAQNAGKSTLINMFAKNERVKVTRLTEAPVPGTTLGIVRIPGILPAKAKMYDTPGLLHPYLMTMRLNREEQKMVEVRKVLKPRTYRILAGHTVHVGGLVRLDMIQCSTETIYVTVWASPLIPLHLGKTDRAAELQSNHFGIRLRPPIGKDRATDLGEWKRREFRVSGTSWLVNSVDLSVSGLGWFSLGLKGEATVVLWTFEGVQLTQREPLILDRALCLLKPGFSLPNAVSEVVGDLDRMEVNAKEKFIEEDI